MRPNKILPYFFVTNSRDVTQKLACIYIFLFSWLPINPLTHTIKNTHTQKKEWREREGASEEQKKHERRGGQTREKQRTAKEEEKTLEKGEKHSFGFGGFLLSFLFLLFFFVILLHNHEHHLRSSYINPLENSIKIPHKLQKSAVISSIILAKTQQQKCPETAVNPSSKPSKNAWKYIQNQQYSPAMNHP